MTWHGPLRANFIFLWQRGGRQSLVWLVLPLPAMEPLAGLRTEAQIHGFPTVIDLPKVRVAVVEGPDAGKHFDSDDEMLVRIGTRENNGLVLSDKSVSGYHMEITGTQSGWRLRDVGSTNGTFVAGMRVFDLVPRSGTVVALGRSKLRSMRSTTSPCGRRCIRRDVLATWWARAW